MSSVEIACQFFISLLFFTLASVVIIKWYVVQPNWRIVIMPICVLFSVAILFANQTIQDSFSLSKYEIIISSIIHLVAVTVAMICWYRFMFWQLHNAFHSTALGIKKIFIQIHKCVQVLLFMLKGIELYANLEQNAQLSDIVNIIVLLILITGYAHMVYLLISKLYALVDTKTNDNKSSSYSISVNGSSEIDKHADIHNFVVRVTVLILILLILTVMYIILAVVHVSYNNAVTGIISWIGLTVYCTYFGLHIFLMMPINNATYNSWCSVCNDQCIKWSDRRAAKSPISVVGEII